MASAYFILRALRRNVSKIKVKSNKIACNVPVLKCRLCLQEGTIPINSSDEFVDAIRLICDVQVVEGDSFPQHLCQECCSFLQKAVEFRKRAKETENFLRNKVDYEEYQDNETPSTALHNLNVVKTTIPIKCKICDLTFDKYRDLVVHRKSVKHRNVKILCSICNKLITKPMFLKHLQRHQATSHLICEVCGKLYRKDNLIRHMQIHSAELPYHCHMCPYRGRFVQSLSLHMRTHTGEKPYSCDKCNLQFLTRSNLNRHILTHSGEKPFKCNECSRGFYRKRDMEIHFRSDHTGIKEFECELCNMKYGSKKALMRHEIRVHKREKKLKGRMPLYLQDEFRFGMHDQTSSYGTSL